MKWRRIRKLANAAGWFWIALGIGLVAGLMLSTALVGIPRAEHPPIIGPASLEFLDLIAQRSMSDAAWWMVIITVVSALVGGLGLYLIARTLQEAKRSADAAEKTILMAQSAARAYLLVDFAKVWFDASGGVFVEYQVSNSGQTPARNVAFKVDVFASADRTAHRYHVGTSRKSRSDIPFQAKRPARAYIDGFADNEMSVREIPEYAIIVVITMEYEDVITNKRRLEVSTYGCVVACWFPVNQIITLYRDVGGDTGWGEGDAH